MEGETGRGERLGTGTDKTVTKMVNMRTWSVEEIGERDDKTERSTVTDYLSAT